MGYLAGLTALALLAGACGTVESGQPSGSQGAKLPVRDGPRPFTTSGVPHIQVEVEPVPAVDETLRARAFALPGVENRPTVVSLPGGRGLWLEIKRPGKEPTEDQWGFMRKMAAAGGLAFWADSAESVLKQLAAAGYEPAKRMTIATGRK